MQSQHLEFRVTEKDKSGLSHLEADEPIKMDISNPLSADLFGLVL